MDKFIVINGLRSAVVLALLLTMPGCGKDDKDEQPVEGQVTSLSSTIAFHPPGLPERLLALLFGQTVHANMPGMSAVGAGVTVKLIKVDADGNQVGGTVASTKTKSDGSYKLTAPGDVLNDAAYVLRVEGSGGAVMDARVHDKAVDINPVSHVASNFVTSVAGDLDEVSREELFEILAAVDSVAQGVDATAHAGLDSLSSAISSETDNDEEAHNIITSVPQANAICGKITSSASGKGIKGVRVVVRDFGNWVTRAKTKSNKKGEYCVSVPAGDYIIGAINRNDDEVDANRSASEWWSSATAEAGAYLQIDGEKVTVSAGDKLSKDFVLEPGVRIKGTVTANGGSKNGQAIAGVKVLIRDYENRFPAAVALTDDEGHYQVNVIAGKYVLSSVNSTIEAYASEVYDGASGSNGLNFGVPVTVAVGDDDKQIDFALEPGYLLSGTISEGGTGISGMRMRADSTTNGVSLILRANKVGYYQVWLKPDTYNLLAYGQVKSAVDMTAASQTANFTASVAKLPITLTGGGTGFSQAKVLLIDGTGNTVSQEVSSSDGSVTLYTDTSASYSLVVRVDDKRAYGSTVYNGKTQLALADTVALTTGSTATALSIAMPAAGLLTGTISDTSGVIGNRGVQVRSGGLTTTEKFVSISSRGDGSFSFSLPAGTYERVRVNTNAGGANCDSVQIAAGMTTSLSVSDTACTVGTPQ